MVPRVKDNNPLGTQKTVSPDFDEEKAREGRQRNFKTSKWSHNRQQQLGSVSPTREVTVVCEETSLADLVEVGKANEEDEHCIDEGFDDEDYDDEDCDDEDWDDEDCDDEDCDDEDEVDGRDVSDGRT